MNCELDLWHQRLRHPNIDYLSQLFPSLCLNTNYFDFKCDSCTSAKHQRSAYPIVPYRATRPFYNYL